MRKALKLTTPVMVILFFGIVLLGWRQLCRPQIIQGSLRASFAGQTNEAGEILVFLTNCSRWQITYHPRIDTKQSGSWPTLESGTLFDDIAKPRIIQPFTNEPVALALPPGAVEWRLFILYVADTERDKKVEEAQRFFEKIGLPGIGYRIKRDMAGTLFLPEATNP